MDMTQPDIVYVPVSRLRHIEGYSKRRVSWLEKKVLAEQLWTRPLCVDRDYNLVMDGQHRMEVAKHLDLAVVPCLLFGYNEVEIWSLRPNHEVTPELVIHRALSNDVYPYKTVKHRFPIEVPSLVIPLSKLREAVVTDFPDNHKDVLIDASNRSCRRTGLSTGWS
jgi:L-serine kinase (ADP)